MSLPPPQRFSSRCHSLHGSDRPLNQDLLSGEVFIQKRGIPERGEAGRCIRKRLHEFRLIRRVFSRVSKMWKSRESIHTDRPARIIYVSISTHTHSGLTQISGKPLTQRDLGGVDKMLKSCGLLFWRFRPGYKTSSSRIAFVDKPRFDP